MATINSKTHESEVLNQIDAIVRKAISEQTCKSLIKLMNETDLSYVQLFISTGLKYFASVFAFWQKYQSKLGIHISLFMNLLYSKIVYGKMDHLKAPFQRLKDQYQRFTKKKLILLPQQQVQLHSTDHQLLKFANQCQTKKSEPEQQKKGFIFQQQQRPVPAIINVNKDLGTNYVQTRLHCLKQMYFKIKLQHQSEQKKQLQAKLTNQLERRTPISRDCYNCLSFVYENEDLNFPCPSQPIAFFSSIHSMSNMPKEIQQQMVSYLNGKGGILIIGTQIVDNKIVPVVEQVAQFHKQQHESRLKSYISNINPPITINKHIQYSFIPIAQNPRKKPMELQPVWINAAYILKITIIPVEPHITHYYTVTGLGQGQGQTQISTNVFSKDTPKGSEEIKNQSIYQFMKERYRQYNPNIRPSDFTLRDRGNYHPSLIRHIESCRPPQIGDKYYGDKSYYQDNTKKVQNEKKVTNLLLEGYDNFKNISLLVVVSSLIKKIQKMFTDTEKIQNKIATAFPKQKFKLSNNTFLVFHNCKFQKLKNGLMKERLQLKIANDKKDVLLISTLPILAFKASDVSDSILSDLQSRIEQVAREKIEIKKIENVVYVKCVSTITAVYIYFYMHSAYSIKATFEKIPQGSVHKSKINKNNFKNSRPAGKGQKHTRGENYYEDEYLSEDEEDNYVKAHHGPKKQKNNHYVEKPVQNHEDNYYDYTQEASNKVQQPGPQQLNYPAYEAVQPIAETPFCFFVQYDAYGNRYDYFSNYVVYVYDVNGQYVNMFSHNYHPNQVSS